MKEWIVRDQTPIRLDRFFSRELPEVSYGTLQQYLRQNKLKVNGKKVPLSTRIQAGDIVRAYLPQVSKEKVHTDAWLNAKPIFSCLYEDDEVMIGYKPAGILTLDESEKTSDTFQNRARRFLHDNQRLSDDYLPRVCHRLDTGTSGLILIAKTEQAEHQLLSLIRGRSIQKQYLCVTFGHPKPEACTMEAYLVKDAQNSRVRIAPQACKGGQKIITAYRTLARSGALALLEVTLVTGRTHQIRAHMASIGCPVLGDGKYGIEKENRLRRMKYQALCAYRLTFPTLEGPCSGLSEKTFTCDFPWYAQQIMEGTLL